MKIQDCEYQPDFAPGTVLGDGEISLKWFGTACYRFEYQGRVLWIDPYFSRHSFLEVGFCRLRPKPLEIDRYLDRADYVAIGHSHYDHVADLPHIVPAKAPLVFGSRSVGNLFSICGLPADRFRQVAGGDRVRAGPFELSFIKSMHGKLLGRIPYDYDISPDCSPPLRARQHGCGEVFNIVIRAGDYRIYHQGSGGLIREALRGCRADLAIIGISSRKATPRMVFQVVSELQPSVVMPTHYDLFFFSLRAGMRPIPGLSFEQVVREVRDAAPAARVVTLPLQGEFRVRAPSGGAR